MARKKAAKPDTTPVGLTSCDQLVLLLIENGIGVSRRSHNLFEIEEPYDTNADTKAGASCCQAQNIQGAKV